MKPKKNKLLNFKKHQNEQQHEDIACNVFPIWEVILQLAYLIYFPNMLLLCRKEELKGKKELFSPSLFVCYYNVS